MIVALLVFLVAQSFGTAARLDRLGDRVDQMSGRLDGLGRGGKA